MNVKIHSSELNRMMKTLSRCIDGRQQAFSNIEVIYDNNMLALRGTNGSFAAVMSAPVLGGDGETFCVDGEMFAKACSLGKGEVDISTDGKSCIIRNGGRTRLPITTAKIPAFTHLEKGTEIRIEAEAFAKCYSGVEHAISDDMGQTRIALTGVYIEAHEYALRMVSLDGFNMAIEATNCDGTETNILVPGAFMRLIKDSTAAGETISLKTDGQKLMAQTDGMMISCQLLIDSYPDYNRIIPHEHKTECLVNADDLRTALKNNSVVCNNKLVKFEITGDSLKVSGNSEQADYEAIVPCQTHGDDITIAFNQKYIMNTISSIPTEEIVLQFNTPASPCVARGKDDITGLRIVLPVRVQG